MTMYTLTDKLQMFPVWVPSAKGIINGRGIDQSENDCPMIKAPYNYEQMYKEDLDQLDPIIMQRIGDLNGVPGFTNNSEREFLKEAKALLKKSLSASQVEKMMFMVDGSKLSELAASVLEEINDYVGIGSWWMAGDIRRGRKKGNIAATFKVNAYPFSYTLEFLRSPTVVRVSFNVMTMDGNVVINEIFPLPSKVSPKSLIPFLDKLGYDIRYIYYDTQLALRLLSQGFPVVK